MAAYKIFFRKSVQKDLETIPKKDLQRILKRIQDLANDPRPPGSEKLTGQEHYRLRQGIYRILYSIQDNDLTIWIVKVGHRKEVYRQ
jgi:mRNA interferase RelE/StbE